MAKLIKAKSTRFQGRLHCNSLRSSSFEEHEGGDPTAPAMSCPSYVFNCWLSLTLKPSTFVTGKIRNNSHPMTRRLRCWQKHKILCSPRNAEIRDGCCFAENLFRIKKNPWQQSASLSLPISRRRTRRSRAEANFGNDSSKLHISFFFAHSCRLLIDWGSSSCQGWCVLYNCCNCVIALFFSFLIQ